MKPPLLLAWPDPPFCDPSISLALADGSQSSSNRKRARRMKPCDHPDWSGLPGDILSSITDKLTIDDCIRFGAVCTHWRNIVRHGMRPSPLLLVATPADHHHRPLYSLSQNKLCTSPLRVPTRKVCRGSSFGWLVTLEEKTLSHCQIQLLNPFRNRVIHLPPPDNIMQQHPVNYQNGWTSHYLYKALLTSDPCSSPADFVVMAIMSRYQGLAFFKPGDTTWTSIGDDWHRDSLQHRAFTDVIFSHNTNQFYALQRNGALVAIDLLALEAGNPKLTEIAPQHAVADLSLPAYLVEDLSSGDLLVVYYKFNISSEHDIQAPLDHIYALEFDASASLKDTSHPKIDNDSAVQFEVLKFDTSRGIRTRVDNLGGNVMFLGSNGSFLRPSSDCPGCEPNCIYYAGGDLFSPHHDYYGLPDDGVYNLKDGTVKPHYSSERFVDIPARQEPYWNSLEGVIPSPMEYLPQPIWLEPTLKSFG